MWDFGFRTVPNVPPQTEAIVGIAYCVLFLMIATIVISISGAGLLFSPFGFPRAFRVLVALIASHLAIFVSEFSRRRWARKYGVSFISSREHAQLCFNWSKGRSWISSYVQGLLPTVLIVVIGFISLFVGRQFWEMSAQAWLFGFLVLNVASLFFAIVRRLTMVRDSPPPRLHRAWSASGMVVVFVLLLTAHPGPAPTNSRPEFEINWMMVALLGIGGSLGAASVIYRWRSGGSK